MINSVRRWKNQPFTQKIFTTFRRDGAWINAVTEMPVQPEWVVWEKELKINFLSLYLDKNDHKQGHSPVLESQTFVT